MRVNMIKNFEIKDIRTAYLRHYRIFWFGISAHTHVNCKWIPRMVEICKLGLANKVLPLTLIAVLI